MNEGDRHYRRPLDASRDRALREAALALLVEVGYDRLTLEAVAARAHAGKTTIYRRWSGKAEMVVDALSSAKGMPAFPDTGSLAGDLYAAAEAIVSPASQFDARVTIGMITALAHDAELREVFRQRFEQPRTLGFRQLLERAVARGEIARDRDLDLLAQLFPALMLQHLVLHGEVPDAAFAQRIMAHVVLPLTVAPSDASAHSSAATSSAVRGSV
ncbi:MAG: TetR/AcrR family transcriptional regulator [Chloroflexota bacterium]